MKIILFLVLALQGHPPVQHSAEQPSLQECLDAVAEILAHDPPANGSLQAGCVKVGVQGVEVGQ